MRKLPVWLTHWYTYRGAVGILSGFVLALLMFWLYAGGNLGFQRVDINPHPEDRLFSGDSAPADGVVIVGIDDRSIAKLGHFPFVRDVYGRAVDTMLADGAAAAVFDIGFSEAFTPAGDQRFHDSLVKAAGKLPVVLAYGQSELGYGQGRLIQGSVDANGKTRPLAADEIPIRDFRCADSGTDPYAPCSKPISALASTAIVTDADGVVRRMPMFVEPSCHVAGHDCPATLNPIGFEGYRNYFLGQDASKVNLQESGHEVTFGSAWPNPLWVDDHGQAIINYTGAPGNLVRHGQYVSFSDVVDGTVAADKLKGKVLLVGVYGATGIHDEQLVPVGGGTQFMNGVEIHANLVSMFERALNGSFLAPEPPIAVLLTMLLLGVLMGWGVARLSVLWGAAATAGVLVVYTLFWALVGFNALHLVPNLFHVWMVVALSYTGVTAYRFLYEDREKRKVTAIFGQYLKPELVSQLAASRTLDELQLGGERRELTLFFVDIRGFTSMSETMAAEDVVQVTTEYLTDLTRMVFKWDGTIDKYVGDEIMAVWNAPHDDADHAINAIRCAYDCITHAPELQAKLVAMNLPPIRFGIGINTGPAVWGNMGSPMRRQFTALGDTVNTAARFCGAAGPFELLIGERTYELAKDYIAVEMAPGIQLKGKSAETFKIYKVVAIREAVGAPWVPFPTDMATQATYQHTAQYRTQQTMLSAGATISAEAVTRVDAPVDPAAAPTMPLPSGAPPPSE